MAKRDELYQKFGPILFEAYCQMILDYQNEIRKELNMPLLTMDDIILKIENKLPEIPRYNWMQEIN